MLADLSPAMERNIAETQAELVEESRLLDRVVDETLATAGVDPATPSISTDALKVMEPALRRLCLRRLAERSLGSDLPLGRGKADEIMRVASDPEGGEVELGAGLRAYCEHGFVSFVGRRNCEPAEPAVLTVPGECSFGEWRLRAELACAPVQPSGPDRAMLDAAALESSLTVRAWRDGDRMRPLGLEGSKSLQDLFTDRRVPRSIRRGLPVVLSGSRVAWVAGVAVSEEFKLTPDSERVAILDATLPR